MRAERHVGQRGGAAPETGEDEGKGLKKKKKKLFRLTAGARRGKIGKGHVHRSCGVRDDRLSTYGRTRAKKKKKKFTEQKRYA